jgi:hypothetical protein
MPNLQLNRKEYPTQCSCDMALWYLLLLLLLLLQASRLQKVAATGGASCILSICC